jgi:tetratricopeptide (TPR) repeat protein
MTRPHLNGRLLFRLGLGLEFISALIVLVHSLQNGRHARTLCAQSRQAEERGELGRAADYLQRYLVFNPDDTDALLHCGELLEHLAATPYDHERALAIYHQVLAHDPNRHEARHRLAVQAIYLGRYLDAKAQLEVLLEAQPGQADVEALLAECLEAVGEPERAVDLYEQSLEHDPRQRFVYLRLARLLHGTLDRPQQAAAVMDRLVEALSDQAAAYLERALYRMGEGELEGAAPDMARARELAPEDVGVLLAAADLAVRRGRTDEARHCLQRLRDLQPHSLLSYQTLAELEVRAGRLNAAADALRQGLEAVPDHPDLLLALGEVHIACDDFEAAAAVIERLRCPRLPRGLADLLDRELRLRRRDELQALRILQAVIDQGEAAPVLAARAAVAAAEAYERLGEMDRRLAVLRQAVRLDPSSGPGRLGLAAALEAAGRAEEALEQYRQAAMLPHPPEETWVRLARALTRCNQALPAPLRTWEEVDRLLERAARLPSQGTLAAVARAAALLAQDHPEKARTALEQACKQHPDQPEPWQALAALAACRGDTEGAGRSLAEARRRLGDRIELRLAEAERAPIRGRRAAAVLRGLEEGLEKFTASDQEQLLCRLAAAWFQLGETKEGERISRRLADRPGLELGLRVRLLEQALQAGSDDLAARLIADLRRVEGEDGVWWRYGEATRQVGRAQRGDQGSLAAAGTLLEELARLRPDWGRVPVLRAYLAELAGNRTSAVENYRRALELGECQPGVIGRLARLLVERGRDAEAEAVLRRLEQIQPLEGPLARLAADVALRLHNSERAAALARRAVAVEGKDFREQVWLGQVLALAGRPSEAEEALRRAIGLGLDQPETWLALTAHLARAGREADTQAVLEEACATLPADLVPLTLATAHEALGQMAAAEKEYREALRQQPQDGLALQRAASFFVRLYRPSEATPLLRRLLDPAVAVPDANRVWARRQLALAYGGDDRQYAEAQALLKGESADDPAARRARDFVAATRPEGRAEALRRLESSLAALPATADERFRLAKLYEAAGEADKAREAVLEALTLDMQNPEYLAYHIDRLLRAERGDEARPWLGRLEKLEPASVRVREFRKQLAAEP